MTELDTYFARIGFEGAAEPTPTVLGELCLRHASSIPFENITTVLHRDVPIDSQSVFEKLVVRRRGGYCFEQNRLFSDMLRAVGFDVVELAARVVWRRTDDAPVPRTHMVLLVHSGSEPYLCDVGFGGFTLTSPLPFQIDAAHRTRHERFRLVERGDELELQVELGTDWHPVYLFDLQSQQPIDYEVANHYVATHPSSWFRFRLVAARPIEGGRLWLDDTRLTTYGLAGSASERELEGPAELKRVLEKDFGIAVPEDPAFAAVCERLFADA